MKYDGKINLATGFGARSKVWKNKTWNWSDFVKRLKATQVTNETLKEFLAMSKEDQGKVKDVGGYVGGYLRGGRRKPRNVLHRQLATLDIDFAHVDFWEDFTILLGCAAVLHGTHKHHDASPRYRLLIPLSRECSPDEYQAVSRKIAGNLGIELFDRTTFETQRLMYWPSSPKDVEYYFQEQDGPWIDVDELLASYVDWKDTSAWPTSEREIKELGDFAKKQADPIDKRGVVGAFCRTFTITEAIDAFLSEEYVLAADSERYTYTKGSTAAGLQIYDDKFAFSHHGTDPCGGKLSNSFDLVRLHKFGHLDDETAPGQTAKSFVAMEEFARADKRVKKTIAAEVVDDSKYALMFADAGDFDDDTDQPAAADQDLDWMTEMDVDSKGKYLSSSLNINLILSNDPRLKGALKRNTFDSKRYVSRPLPWRNVSGIVPIRDVDYSGIRNYIEGIYGITGERKIDDSLALEFERSSFHPVRDYLGGLEWDGEDRAEELLIRYFGVEDSEYIREISKKFLIAAVKRVFEPGCKFDNVLTLVGLEGTKKSSFFSILGGAWFSDSFTTVHGKESFEQIQGAWIMEIPELAGLSKAEGEAIKHYLSKQADVFRPAYGRTLETFLRQNIFVASTNKWDFLKGVGGDRRFWPAVVHPPRITANVWTDLIEERDQIWAEAVEMYKTGETCYLSPEIEKMARSEQRKHSETDERRGIIEDYLNTPLPADWEKMNIFERQDYLENGSKKKAKERQFVCIAEIWCECLGKNREDMDRYKTRDINEIMRSTEGWSFCATPRNFRMYGKQKYYYRDEI